MVNKSHPNILILTAHLVDEITKTEREMIHLKAGGTVYKQKMPAKYAKICQRREDLMRSYAKNEITREFFLQVCFSKFY